MVEEAAKDAGASWLGRALAGAGTQGAGDAGLFGFTLGSRIGQGVVGVKGGAGHSMVLVLRGSLHRASTVKLLEHSNAGLVMGRVATKCNDVGSELRSAGVRTRSKKRAKQMRASYGTKVKEGISEGREQGSRGSGYVDRESETGSRLQGVVH